METVQARDNADFDSHLYSIGIIGPHERAQTLTYLKGKLPRKQRDTSTPVEAFNAFYNEGGTAEELVEHIENLRDLEAGLPEELQFNDNGKFKSDHGFERVLNSIGITTERAIESVTKVVRSLLPQHTAHDLDIGLRLFFLEGGTMAGLKAIANKELQIDDAQHAETKLDVVLNLTMLGVTHLDDQHVLQRYFINSLEEVDYNYCTDDEAIVKGFNLFWIRGGVMEQLTHFDPRADINGISLPHHALTIEEVEDKLASYGIHDEDDIDLAFEFLESHVESDEYQSASDDEIRVIGFNRFFDNGGTVEELLREV